MARGSMGSLRTIDLTEGRAESEAVDEEACQAWIGGYGLVASLLYDSMPSSDKNHQGFACQEMFRIPKRLFPDLPRVSVVRSPHLDVAS